MKPLVVAGFIVFAWFNANTHADAAPAPMCEHRGPQHAAEHHKTREADSRWHVAHGERPTCGLDDKHDEPEHHDDDGPHVPHRDKPGFGCKLFRGCG